MNFRDVGSPDVAVEWVSIKEIPEGLFESARTRDPVLGNTSILDADFEVLTDYVKKFSDGSWRQPEEINP